MGLRAVGFGELWGSGGALEKVFSWVAIIVNTVAFSKNLLLQTVSYFFSKRRRETEVT